MIKKPHARPLLIVGHRGAAGLAPENTVAAIKLALQHAVDEIEIDVRVCRDQSVVVHHDAAVHDQTGAGTTICDHSLPELRDHKPDLATLDEIITAVNRKAPLMIEVKEREPVEPIAAILQTFLARGWQPTDFYLASKHQPTLRAIHQALPSIPVVVIEPWSGVRAHWRARQVGATRISMNKLWLWGYFIRAVARSGIRLYTYTLNDPVKAQRWHADGLTGVITDRPDLYQ